MKSFRETFPELEIDEYFENLFDETEVTSISRTADRSGLNIHIVSKRLIDKKDIFKMENILRTGLFGEGSPIRIRIVETFDLAAKYSLESLLKTYRDSILEEIKRCSSIELQLLKRADWEVENGDTIVLNYKEEIPEAWKNWTDHSANFLKQVLSERFQCAAQVRTVFPEHVEEKVTSVADLKAQMKPALDFSWQNRDGNKDGFPGGGDGRASSADSRDPFGGALEPPTPPDEYFAGLLANDAGVPFSENRDASAAFVSGNASGTDNASGSDKASGSSSAGVSAGSSSGSGSASAGKSSGSGSAGSDQKGKKGYESRYSGRGSYNRKGGNNFGSDKEKYPDLVFGRYFEEDFVPLEDITDDMGMIAVRGCVVSTELKPLRKYPEKGILITILTDYTDSIMVKIFCTLDEYGALEKEIAPGKFLAVKGSAAFNSYDSQVEISSVSGIKKIPDFRVFRMDESEEKRVELHLMTKMSEMDAVTSIEDYIKNAKRWGHTAMAVTDHGCAYAFPQAAHYLRDTKDKDFKMIYGIQGYVVDDSKRIVMNYHPSKAEDGTVPEEERISIHDTAVVFDLETTGLTAGVHKIIEFGAVKVKNGVVVDDFCFYVNPQEPLSSKITELTSIRDSDLVGAETFDVMVPKFLEFCKDAKFIVGHNVEFDIKFVKHFARELGMDFNPVYMDTVTMAQILLPKLNRYKLDTVGKELKIPPFHHHRAVDDAGATAAIFFNLTDMLTERAEGEYFDTFLEKILVTSDQIKKMHPFDASILMRDLTGKVNLYHLISDSNIKYLNRVPRLPWSLIEEYREGLLIGSSGADGELFQALMEGENDDVIAGIVERYDYLEIMPAENHAHFIDEESSYISSLEDIRDLNRRIVKLG
ncbi:MAG: PHP domain-containing protein, partial [Lachnospiraceae bacterium]|nr:PHP domain-containing protein [Lachnospiraceae bacterium]